MVIPPKRLTYFIFLILTLFPLSVVQAQDIKTFPFAGEVTTDRVSIRAGANTNFEKIGVLNKGDHVLVLEANYQWYKIKNPFSVENYVIKKYVHKIQSNEGEVTADDVNVRARPAVESTVVAQLAKGRHVKILEDAKDWYRIEPPEESFGWVSEQFIVFKSKNVESLQRQEPLASLEKAQIQTTIVTQGRLQKISSEQGVAYQLSVDNQPVCSFQVQGYPLDRFLNHVVEVEGTIENSAQQPAVPVLNVRRLQLVL